MKKENLIQFSAKDTNFKDLNLEIPSFKSKLFDPESNVIASALNEINQEREKWLKKEVERIGKLENLPETMSLELKAISLINMGYKLKKSTKHIDGKVYLEYKLVKEV